MHSLEHEHENLKVQTNKCVQLLDAYEVCLERRKAMARKYMLRDVENASRIDALRYHTWTLNSELRMAAETLEEEKKHRKRLEDVVKAQKLENQRLKDEKASSGCSSSSTTLGYVVLTPTISWTALLTLLTRPPNAAGSDL